MSTLTVLGSCGGWPEPGRACSGYLLEHDGFRVLLDLGHDTLGGLLEVLGSTVADGLDAVVVSHEHPDHMVDLNGLFRARWFGARRSTPLPVLAAPGVLDALVAIEGEAKEILQVFEWTELPTGDLQLGPFLLASWSLPHFVPNVGVRLASSELVVAFTGDTGPSPLLAEVGRKADLFIVEATDRHQRADVPAAPDGPAFHLDASEAGAAAHAAGAARMLLTHFWPGNDREASRAAAEQEFDGEVLVADEGLVVEL